MAGPLSAPEPWNLVAPDYRELVVPLFEPFARRGIELLGLAPSGARVLDVACGPGTASFLCAEQGHQVDAIDFSPQMLAQFETRRSAHAAAAKLRSTLMDGQDLRFEDATFDAALSMFGLMFFPDRARALGELERVLVPGGRVVVSSWLPLTESPAMAWGFGAFGAIVPPPPPDAPAREPMLEDPQVFAAELEAAGFIHVKVSRVSAAMPIPSIEEFWTGMVRSSAPIAFFRSRVSEQEWEKLNAKALARLRETAPPDLTKLSMEAWLGQGEKR